MLREIITLPSGVTYELLGEGDFQLRDHQSSPQELDPELRVSVEKNLEDLSLYFLIDELGLNIPDVLTFLGNFTGYFFKDLEEIKNPKNESMIMAIKHGIDESKFKEILAKSVNLYNLIKETILDSGVIVTEEVYSDLKEKMRNFSKLKEVDRTDILDLIIGVYRTLRINYEYSHDYLTKDYEVRT